MLLSRILVEFDGQVEAMGDAPRVPLKGERGWNVLF